MKKRKILIAITTGIAAVLITCTFLSRTVSAAFLPQVSAEAVRQGTLQRTQRVEGSVVLGEEKTVYSPCKVEIDAVVCSEGTPVQKGEEVLALNAQQFEIQKEQLEVAVIQLEIEGETWKSDAQLSEWQKRLDIAERQLNQYVSNYPEGGIVRAEESGQILSVEVHSGETVEKGAPLYTYYTEENVAPYISFVLSEDTVGLEVGDEVEIEYEQTNVVNNEEITTMGTASCKIEEKVFIEGERWSFKANLEDAQGMKDRQQVTVRSSTEERMYSQIVPSTAVYRVDDIGTVYVLRTREGLFGEETYVQEIEVDEITSNERYVALSAEELTGASVIVSTDKSLADGMQVKVME